MIGVLPIGPRAHLFVSSLLGLLVTHCCSQKVVPPRFSISKVMFDVLFLFWVCKLMCNKQLNLAPENSRCSCNLPDDSSPENLLGVPCANCSHRNHRIPTHKEAARSTVPVLGTGKGSGVRIPRTDGLDWQMTNSAKLKYGGGDPKEP